MLSRTLLAIALLGEARPSCGSAPPEATCAVSTIVDGDTFHCRDGRRVRLIGVDSPEGRQGEPGALARRALGRLLPRNQPVRLEGDAAPRDRYGRVLAYAWTGSTLVNEAMIRQGWAVLYTVPPNVKYAGRFARAQKEARAANAGLWASGGFDCPPSDFRRGRCTIPP